MKNSKKRSLTLLPKQVTSAAQMEKMGYAQKEIMALSASLRIFPTPFKGVYYIPLEEERKAAFIEKPLMALTHAVSVYLGGAPFYYSCETAEEEAGIRWQPSNEVHIVNEKRSGGIDLAKRMKRNGQRGTWRAKKIARILSFYGEKLVFHRAVSIKGAKTKATPSGRFAVPSQIEEDMARFHRKKVRP